MKVFLSRSSIWKKLTGLDITVKSGKELGKKFAPTWNMVMGHKQGKITDEQYTELYLNMLKNTEEEVFEELYKYGLDNENKINLICYCHDGKFCHTYLLIDFLVEKFPERYEK